MLAKNALCARRVSSVSDIVVVSNGSVGEGALVVSKGSSLLTLLLPAPTPLSPSSVRYPSLEQASRRYAVALKLSHGVLLTSGLGALLSYRRILACPMQRMLRCRLTRSSHLYHPALPT